MAICPNCLSDMPEGKVLCDVCEATAAKQAEVKPVEECAPVEIPAELAAPVEPAAPQFYPEFVAPQPVVEPMPAFHVPLTKEQLPVQFKPLGAWAYFGYALLFAIPVIGWIVLLVLALGGTRNLNLRSFARSYFCALLVWLILAGIAVGAVFALGVKLDEILKYIPQFK